MQNQAGRLQYLLSVVIILDNYTARKDEGIFMKTLTSMGNVGNDPRKARQKSFKICRVALVKPGLHIDKVSGTNLLTVL